MKPARVLLALGGDPPTQQALWEEVARRNVDLQVAYTLDVPWNGSRISPAFGETHELGGVCVRGNHPTWMAYRGFGALLRRIRPAIVHVQNEPWSLVASQAVVAGNAAVVTHGWENLWDHSGAIEATVRRLVTRRNLHRSSGFASSNSDGVAWARRRGLPAGSPTLVMPSALPNIDHFARPETRRQEGRDRWGLRNELIFGFVGRLVPEKGIAWLLESWRGAELDDQARLVFVGEGPMEPLIRSAAMTDSRIRLVGPEPIERIPAVMAALDVLVLPSLTTRDWCEQFGRVLIEAFASERPVIASDSGAIPEVVADAGLLVREGVVAELAAALQRVGEDASLRHDMAEAGLVRAQNVYSPHVNADRIVEFWGEVARKRSESEPPHACQAGGY